MVNTKVILSEMCIRDRNTATAIPIYPSSSMLKKWDIKAAISTADVDITSFLLSADVASRVEEFIFLPRDLLNTAIQSFTRIEPISTAAVTMLK